MTKRNRRQVVDILRCKDGVTVPIKQPRVVSAIRDRDALIAKLEERLTRAQVALQEEVGRRHALLDARWSRLGLTLRLLKP